MGDALGCEVRRVSYICAKKCFVCALRKIKTPYNPDSYKGYFVRMKGLEPPRPETLDPKSNAATNYATCAGLRAKVGIFLEIAKFFLFGGVGSFFGALGGLGEL